MIVRPAVAGDSALLADIHVASWQAAYRGVFPDDYLDGLDRGARARWFRKAMGENRSIFVAPDDRPAGFCWVGASPEEGWGEVFSIYVQPDQWGMGRGRDLLRAGEEELASQGFKKAYLWVLDSNRRARSFYERQGWALAKRIRLEEIAGTQVTEVRYEVDLTRLP